MPPYPGKRRNAHGGNRKGTVPKALRQNGMHPANSIVHRLAPTIAGAQAGMQEILERGEPLAACYFAENDLIAIGAVRALKAKGCACRRMWRWPASTTFSQRR